ncbi:MAG: small, acid-soluble spore protein, alpha/beta type [Oscillospiraceae bacterium]|nr:small, acid-soluble spore protein, alpha/beta type [Oscillospiraceae bacterium]
MGMKSNNQINIPQAREAMDKFKMQAASDKGVPSTY